MKNCLPEREGQDFIVLRTRGRRSVMTSIAIMRNPHAEAFGRRAFAEGLTMNSATGSKRNHDVTWAR